MHLKTRAGRRVARPKSWASCKSGWKENEFGLTSCEDSSVVRFFDESRQGRDSFGRLARYVQRLTVVKLGWSMEGVDSR